MIKNIKPNQPQTFKRKACQSLVALALVGLTTQAMAAAVTVCSSAGTETVNERTLCDQNALDSQTTYDVTRVTMTAQAFYDRYITGKMLEEINVALPWFGTSPAGLVSWTGSLSPFVLISSFMPGIGSAPTNILGLEKTTTSRPSGTATFGTGLTNPTTYNFLIAAINNVINNVSQDISLQSTSQAVAGVDSNINMMVYGAHSRPLSHLVAEGEKTAWVAGDIGRDDHGSRSGSTGLAEINAGYNFGPAQVNVTLGQTWANQNLAFGGNLNADGQYVMLEAIAPISKERKLYAVVSGFGHWGDSDVRRGYINGGALNSSKGNTDTETYGVRARLEWLDAKEIAGVQLSPYADVSYVKSHMDGYTEKNGPTNATFNSRNDDNTTFRLGFNAMRPISGTHFNLVGNLEAAHATSDDSGSISGAIAGTAFNVASIKVQDNWVKAGVGAEGTIGKGKGTLMLNGTTSSGLPNAWLAASYQMNF